MTAAEIRRQFIEFFREKGHTFVPSASVVPYDDPTLHFTNAGMNQFKDVFFGTGRRDYTRAVNSQKCIRAGGKHNDLDDVGHDTYHHTFFEMLGNWSFGDYFKAEAIAWAWELLTDRWGLDKARLHATVFEGDPTQGLQPDEEAADLWRRATDIDPAHVHYGSRKDNFWEMGETGPCGPCSELHIDLTPDLSGAALVNAGDARVIEIWNLVFIQFNRDSAGKLTPLPASHVDTGMGFERISAVLQQVNSNYDTDIFRPIFDAIQHLTKAPAYTGKLEAPGQDDPQIMIDVSYRVIADHLRCLTFSLADGALPGNDGAGYILRRILRRAVRYGRRYLDVHQPFLGDLVPVVVEVMGDAFPELGQNPQHIIEVVRDEETSFARTYERGVKLFEEAAARAADQGSTIISGAAAFKLHDTYGFSIDLTKIMAEERALSVDERDYDRLLHEAREIARGGANKSEDLFQRLNATDLQQAGSCDDSPRYDADLLLEAQITACVQEGLDVAFLTDRTCFYAEQGGQVADTGWASCTAGRMQVYDVQRHGDLVVHYGRVVEGAAPSVRDHCTLEVGAGRSSIMQNHTATHIMNWALRDVLGDHIDQKGSLVDADKTRFDFSHTRPVTHDELRAVEARANEQLQDDLAVHTAVVPLADARRVNTLRAVFGEKYPDQVRVVSIGVPVAELLQAPQDPRWMAYSVEFCGGTHLDRTGLTASIRFIEEGAVAKGIRRVTAVTGERAEACMRTDHRLRQDCQALATLPDDALSEHLPAFVRQLTAADCTHLARVELREQVAKLQERAKKLAKEQARSGAQDVRSEAARLLDSAEEIGGVRVIVGQMPGGTPEQIREALDHLRTQAGSAAILLGTTAGEKVLLFAAMTTDVVKRGLRAGDLIKEVAPTVGGGGGGKPELAQAGGRDPAGLPQALIAARHWIVNQLQP